MSEHVPNRDLTPDLVPALDADFLDASYPFSMTFDGLRCRIESL